MTVEKDIDGFLVGVQNHSSQQGIHIEVSSTDTATPSKTNGGEDQSAKGNDKKTVTFKETNDLGIPILQEGDLSTNTNPGEKTSSNVDNRPSEIDIFDLLLTGVNKKRGQNTTDKNVADKQNDSKDAKRINVVQNNDPSLRGLTRNNSLGMDIINFIAQANKAGNTVVVYRNKTEVGRVNFDDIINYQGASKDKKSVATISEHDKDINSKKDLDEQGITKNVSDAISTPKYKQNVTEDELSVNATNKTTSTTNDINVFFSLLGGDTSIDAINGINTNKATSLERENKNTTTQKDLGILALINDGPSLDEKIIDSSISSNDIDSRKTRKKYKTPKGINVPNRNVDISLKQKVNIDLEDSAFTFLDAEDNTISVDNDTNSDSIMTQFGDKNSKTTTDQNDLSILVLLQDNLSSISNKKIDKGSGSVIEEEIESEKKESKNTGGVKISNQKNNNSLESDNSLDVNDLFLGLLGEENNIAIEKDSNANKVSTQNEDERTIIDEVDLGILSLLDDRLSSESNKSPNKIIDSVNDDILGFLLSGIGNKNRQTGKNNINAQTKNSKKSKGMKTPDQKIDRDFTSLLLGDIEPVAMKIDAASLNEIKLERKNGKPNIVAPQGSISISETKIDKKNTPKPKGGKVDNEITILGILLEKIPQDVTVDETLNKQDTSLDYEEGSGVNEGSGDYMNDENVKTTDPINDDFVVQIANTNNIKTGLINSSYDDKNDILDGTKVENVKSFNDVNQAKNIDSLKDQQFNILSILLEDAPNTSEHNSSYNDTVKNSMVLKGDIVKIIMLKDVKDKDGKATDSLNATLDATIKHKEGKKMVRKIQGMNDVEEKIQQEKLGNNEIDSDLFLFLVDSMEQTDEILLTAENSQPNEKDVVDPCTRSGLCSPNSISNSLKNVETDDGITDFLIENLRATFGDVKEGSGQNEDRAYPYYPNTYFPP